jgi:hypothetical protein
MTDKPTILVIGCPPDIAESIRQEAERQHASGRVLPQIVACESGPAAFIVDESPHAPTESRAWRTTLRRMRCAKGHELHVYDATIPAATSATCSVCCPEFYAPKPEQETPRPRLSLGPAERQGLRAMMYAWALDHLDDPGESGNRAAWILAAVDAERDRS